MRWFVIVKFNRDGKTVWPYCRSHLKPYGVEVWWTPKMD